MIKIEQNPWEILKVHRKSSNIAISNAFRELVKLYHPDQGGETADADKFAKVKWAYDQIKNEALRRKTLTMMGHLPTCTHCGGRGATGRSVRLTEKIYTPCNACGGSGYIFRKKPEENG